MIISKLFQRMVTSVNCDAVQERACLWDLSADAYKDRNAKVKAWLEVCDIVLDGFEELSYKEKN